jgi:hypothetical protein
MHFYSFNIGDYISHTRHLTVIEDCAYRRLLDLYYLHEQPLNECSTTVARAINMRDHEDEAASRAGKASAERRSNARSTTVQPNNKQETINIKQETKISTRDKPLSCPDGVGPEVWDGFLKVRKAKKAPVTQAALAGIEREARKAGWSLNAALTECCARGWAGFKADWVKDEKTKTMSHADASKLAAARAIFGDERNLNNDEHNTIDITPRATAPAGFLGAEDFHDDAGSLRDTLPKHVEDGPDFT